MTRKDILKKYGFSWMSNVNLKEELSEQTGDKNGEDNSIRNHSCNYNAALSVML